MFKWIKKAAARTRYAPGKAPRRYQPAARPAARIEPLESRQLMSTVTGPTPGGGPWAPPDVA